MAGQEVSTVTGAGQQIGLVAEVGSHCVTEMEEVAWQSMPVSSVKWRSLWQHNANMEETGILENPIPSDHCYPDLNQARWGTTADAPGYALAPFAGCQRFPGSPLTHPTKTPTEMGSTTGAAPRGAATAAHSGPPRIAPVILI